MEEEEPQIMESGKAVHETNIIETQESRDYLFIGPFVYPQLANIEYKTLFHMCRIEQINFDMELNQGTSFMLYDDPRCQLLGIMIVGTSIDLIFEEMEKTMLFMKKHFEGEDKELDRLILAIRAQMDS